MNAEISLKMKKIEKAGSIKICKIIFEKDAETMEMCLGDSTWDYRLNDTVVCAYNIDSINGHTPLKEDVDRCRLMDVTGVQITCDGRKDPFDASELDDLNITNLLIDHVYMAPFMLYRYQHVTLPIKGKDEVLSRYDYEQIAKVIRENDHKSYAHNALENYDGISENTREILKLDLKFPEFFDKSVSYHITNSEEEDIIEEYLKEHYGSEIEADFVSEKQTGDECSQVAYLPEKIIDDLMDYIEKKKDGENVDPLSLPVLCDEFGEEIDLQDVDKINKL